MILKLKVNRILNRIDDLDVAAASELLPLATSLTFGLAFNTYVVLVLAPVMYLLIAKKSPVKLESHPEKSLYI